MMAAIATLKVGSFQELSDDVAMLQCDDDAGQASKVVADAVVALASFVRRR